MFDLKHHFYAIHELRTLTQDTYKKAQQENTPEAWMVFKFIESEYLRFCDTGRRYLDSIPDPKMALALRLHYINGLNWRETALQMGDTRMRRQCRDFLRKAGRKNAWLL